VRACVALAGPFDFGECWDGLPQLTRRTFEVRSRASGEADAKRLAGTLSLQGQAERITAPLLIVFGRKDRLIPWQQAERLRETAGGHVEMLMLEDGNHGCANVAPWHRPYTADWLAERLGRG
jgi:pimeloyl-ACP methyl ester carboxylesterase